VDVCTKQHCRRGRATPLLAFVESGASRVPRRRKSKCASGQKESEPRARARGPAAPPTLGFRDRLDEPARSLVVDLLTELFGGLTAPDGRDGRGN